jgi:RimJ/RimL family protein N-acetyltransferase
MSKTPTSALPLGDIVPHWETCVLPQAVTLKGRYCELHPMQPEHHAAPLFQHYEKDPGGGQWLYMLAEQPQSAKAFRDWLVLLLTEQGTQAFAIIDPKINEPVGMVSYLRIKPTHGVLEIGNVNFSLSMQRTPMGTETIYLMLRQAFQAHYRRCEWKCDSLNKRSYQAALRYGFTFEGIFRQAMVYNGRNRDTAWFSMLDKEWPVLEKAFEAWLNPSNFSPDGRQKKALSALIQQAVVQNKQQE